MDFNLPSELISYLRSLDTFIEKEITPLQESNDNQRFFDHRREHSRPDWAAGGTTTREWEDLLLAARQRADRAGFLRFSLSREYGGSGGSNLWMAVIREHLAAKGLGLFNDLQTEASVVGNFPIIEMFSRFGTEAQKTEFILGQLNDRILMTFGLTEPNHGSDATHLETFAVHQSSSTGHPGWLINGSKMWQTGQHRATHCIVFARTSGKPGSSKGITAFIVPADAEGVRIESYQWCVLSLYHAKECRAD
jgi:alkylation response protein AidB-like acyl-CoA dehydrogenase